MLINEINICFDNINLQFYPCHDGPENPYGKFLSPSYVRVICMYFKGRRAATATASAATSMAKLDSFKKKARRMKIRKLC